MLNIIIPTKNNYVALSGLLSSLVSGMPVTTDKKEVHIVIVDATPAHAPSGIQPQLERLCKFLNVTYLTFNQDKGDVNSQRLRGLEEFDDSEVVFCLDDDLVLVDSYFEEACYIGRHLITGTMFGVTVDMLNDRGYEDYCIEGAQDNSHAFTSMSASGGAYLCDSASVRSHTATVGHMIAPVRKFRNVLEWTKANSNHPAIADDAAATILARTTGGPLLHNGLKAWHVGNYNNNWHSLNMTMAEKQAAVDALAIKGIEELGYEQVERTESL